MEEAPGSLSNQQEVYGVIRAHSPNGQTNEAMLLCEKAVEPVKFCLSAWSRSSQQSWSPSHEFALEIHREVARAIG